VDGLTLLEKIKGEHPDLPVIIICGHANIEAAVRATRLGASDFIEKPFSIEAILASITRALGDAAGPDSGEPEWGGAVVSDNSDLVVPQKTISRSVTASGRGLHTGMKTGVILHPVPAGTGIFFQSLATEKSVPAHIDFADSTGYATTLFRGGFGAKTVEHLLATLQGYGITNLMVKMEGEVPILDGSASVFCELIEDAGIIEQPGPGVEPFIVRERHAVEIGGNTIVVEPHDGLVIDYALDYPAPVGQQNFVFDFKDVESFKREIAPARTFGFVHEFRQLVENGLAAGGQLDNCVLIGEDGVINGELRFKDEFARHKILDAIGDFALLGQPLRARITARATGHRHNVAMVRELLAAV
ncbi:MAG: UDP-3-O-acyl-N-acetylglucosamine deacetylase, partial [bacterium]